MSDHFQASSLTVRPFATVYVHTAQFEEHPEITHEDTSTMDYKLRLFVDDEMSKLEVKANKTWTPAHRPYVL